MDLNSYWRMLKGLVESAAAIDKAWKQDGNESSLVWDYKIEEIVREAKVTLVRAAVAQVLAKHGIRNVTVPEEVFNKIREQPDFSVETTEEGIKQPYIADATAEACRQLTRAAHILVPYRTGEKPKLDDIVSGRRLTLQIHWSYDWIDSSRYENLTAFQVLLYCRLMHRDVPSYSFDGRSTIGQVIESFRDGKQPFNQARSYVYDDGIFESFRIYKNGHIEITFKKEEYAQEGGRLLLE